MMGDSLRKEKLDGDFFSHTIISIVFEGIVIIYLIIYDGDQIKWDIETR